MLFLMEKSVKKLDTYVLSMHDYYSLQRGELKITEIDFHKIIDDLKAIYTVLAKINDVAFNISVKQEEVFRSDEAPLRLIFNNLLSNAFKYQDKKSKSKSVEVIVKVQKNVATIYVKDTGIGILGSHVGEIFNLFYRANFRKSGRALGCIM